MRQDYLKPEVEIEEFPTLSISTFSPSAPGIDDTNGDELPGM